MFLNSIDVGELDYFDMLRLNGKDAVFEVSPGKMFIACEGVKYLFDSKNMKCSDLDLEKPPIEALKEFKANEVPLDTMNLSEKGILILHNFDDQHWLFAFASSAKNICLIRTGTFEKTLGEL